MTTTTPTSDTPQTPQTNHVSLPHSMTGIPPNGAPGPHPSGAQHWQDENAIHPIDEDDEKLMELPKAELPSPAAAQDPLMNDYAVALGTFLDEVGDPAQMSNLLLSAILKHASGAAANQVQTTDQVQILPARPDGDCLYRAITGANLLQNGQETVNGIDLHNSNVHLQLRTQIAIYLHKQANEAVAIDDQLYNMLSLEAAAGADHSVAKGQKHSAKEAITASSLLMQLQSQIAHDSGPKNQVAAFKHDPERMSLMEDHRVQQLLANQTFDPTTNQGDRLALYKALMHAYADFVATPHAWRGHLGDLSLFAAATCLNRPIVVLQEVGATGRHTVTTEANVYYPGDGGMPVAGDAGPQGSPIFISYTDSKRHFNVVVPDSHTFQFLGGQRTLIAPPHETIAAPLSLPSPSKSDAPKEIGQLSLSASDRIDLAKSGAEAEELQDFCDQYDTIKFVKMQGRDRVAGMLLVSTPLDYLRQVDTPDDAAQDDKSEDLSATPSPSLKSDNADGKKLKIERIRTDSPEAPDFLDTDMDGAAVIELTQINSGDELTVTKNTAYPKGIGTDDVENDSDTGDLFSLNLSDDEDDEQDVAIDIVKRPSPGQVTVAERYKVVQVNDEDDIPRFYIEGERNRLVPLANFEAALRNNNLLSTDDDPVLYDPDDKQADFVLAENDETKLLREAEDKLAPDLEDDASDQSSIDPEFESKERELSPDPDQEAVDKARKRMETLQTRSKCDANRLRNSKGALADPDNAGTPIRTLMLKLSRQSDFYLEQKAALGGRADRSGAVRRVDGLAPSIPEKVAYFPPKYEYYTFPAAGFTNASTGFSMFGMLFDGRKDNLCIFMSETGTHQDDVTEKQTGYDEEDDKKAAITLRGPILCELKGVSEVAVVQGAPGMKGTVARGFTDCIRHIKNACKGTKDDVVLFIRTKDGAQHQLTMAQDSVRMELLSPRPDKAHGAAVNKASQEYDPATFANINVYSYDGNYIGHKSTESGYPEPVLGTSTTATVEAGPALTPGTGPLTVAFHAVDSWFQDQAQPFGQGTYATALNRLPKFIRGTLVSWGAEWMANQASRELNYVAGAQGVGAQDISSLGSLGYAGAKELFRLAEEVSVALVGKLVPKQFDLQRDPTFCKTTTKFALTLGKEFTRKIWHEFLLLQANKATLNTRKSSFAEQFRNGLWIGITASAVQRTVKELGLQPTDYRVRAMVDLATQLLTDVGRAMANASEWEPEDIDALATTTPSPLPAFNTTQPPFTTTAYNETTAPTEFFTTDNGSGNFSGNLTAPFATNGMQDFSTTADFYTSTSAGSGIVNITSNATFHGLPGTSVADTDEMDPSYNLLVKEILVSSLIKNAATKYSSEPFQALRAERHWRDQGTSAYDSQTLLFGNYTKTFAVMHSTDLEHRFDSANSESFWPIYQWSNSWVGQSVNNGIRTLRVCFENLYLNCTKATTCHADFDIPSDVRAMQSQLDSHLFTYTDKEEDAANDDPLSHDLFPENQLTLASRQVIRSQNATGPRQWIEQRITLAYRTMSDDNPDLLHMMDLRFRASMLPEELKEKANSYHEHGAANAKFDVVRGPNRQWVTQKHLQNNRGHVNEERLAQAQEVAAESAHSKLVEMQDRNGTRDYILNFAQDRKLVANCQRAVSTFMNRKTLVQLGMRIPEMGAPASTQVCHGIKFQYLKYSLDLSNTSNPSSQREFSDQLYINIAARACPSLPTVAFVARGVKYDFVPSVPDALGQSDVHTTRGGGHTVRNPADHNPTERKVKTGDVLVNAPADQYTLSVQAAAIQGYASTFGNLSMRQTQFIAVQCETTKNWAHWKTEHNATVAMMPYAVFTAEVIWDGSQPTQQAPSLEDQPSALQQQSTGASNDSLPNLGVVVDLKVAPHTILEENESTTDSSDEDEAVPLKQGNDTPINIEDAINVSLDVKAKSNHAKQPAVPSSDDGRALPSGLMDKQTISTTNESEADAFPMPQPIGRQQSSKLSRARTNSLTSRGSFIQSGIFDPKEKRIQKEDVRKELLGQTTIMKQVDTYRAQAQGFQPLDQLHGNKAALPLFIDPANGQLKHVDNPTESYGLKDMVTARAYKDAAGGFSTIAHSSMVGGATGRTSMEASIHAIILREEDLTVRHYPIRVRADSPDYSLAQPKDAPTRLQRMFNEIEQRSQRLDNLYGDENGDVSDSEEAASQSVDSDQAELKEEKSVASAQSGLFSLAFNQQDQDRDNVRAALRDCSKQDLLDPAKQRKPIEHIEISGLDLALESSHHQEFRSRHWSSTHRAIRDLVYQQWTDRDNHSDRISRAQKRGATNIDIPSGGTFPDAEQTLQTLAALDPRYPSAIADETLKLTGLADVEEDISSIPEQIALVRDVFVDAINNQVDMGSRDKEKALAQAREALVQDIFDHLVATSPVEQSEQVKKSFREDGAWLANQVIGSWHMDTNLAGQDSATLKGGVVAPSLASPASSPSPSGLAASPQSSKAASPPSMLGAADDEIDYGAPALMINGVGYDNVKQEMCDTDYSSDDDDNENLSIGDLDVALPLQPETAAASATDATADNETVTVDRSRLAIQSASWVIGRPIHVFDVDSATGRSVENKALSCDTNEFGGSFFSAAMPLLIGRDENGNFLALRQTGGKGVGGCEWTRPIAGDCRTVSALLHAVNAGINPDEYVAETDDNQSQKALSPRPGRNDHVNKTTTSLLDTIKRFCQVDCAYIKDSLTKSALGDDVAPTMLSDRQRRKLLSIGCDAPVARELRQKLVQLDAQSKSIEKSLSARVDNDIDGQVPAIGLPSLLSSMDADYFGQYGTELGNDATLIDPTSLVPTLMDLEQELAELDTAIKLSMEPQPKEADSPQSLLEDDTDRVDIVVVDNDTVSDDDDELNLLDNDPAHDAKANKAAAPMDEETASLIAEKRSKIKALLAYTQLFNECAKIAGDLQRASLSPGKVPLISAQAGWQDKPSAATGQKTVELEHAAPNKIQDQSGRSTLLSGLKGVQKDPQLSDDEAVDDAEDGADIIDFSELNVRLPSLNLSAGLSSLVEQAEAWLAALENHTPTKLDSMPAFTVPHIAPVYRSLIQQLQSLERATSQKAAGQMQDMSMNDDAIKANIVVTKLQQLVARLSEWCDAAEARIERAQEDSRAASASSSASNSTSDTGSSGTDTEYELEADDEEGSLFGSGDEYGQLLNPSNDIGQNRLSQHQQQRHVATPPAALEDGHTTDSDSEEIDID